MVKIKKDGVKNIYCSTCAKWMTEFYVSRHIHSKSHFTKKFFQTEHLQKALHAKKKLPSTLKHAKGNKKKPRQVIKPGYEHYRIHGDVIKNCSQTDDQSDLSARRSLPATTRGYEFRNGMMDQNAVIKQEPQDQYEDRNEMMDQNAVIKQEPHDQYEDRNEMMDQNVVIKQEPQDHFSARENCKTPENVQEYKIKGDTLKKCRHGHTNIHLEGCSDIEPSPSCTPDLREHVKQRLYESHVEDENGELGGIPQNLMDAVGFDYDWDIDSMLAGGVTQANPFVETAEMPEEIFSKEQNKLETSTVYQIEVVRGLHQEPGCSDSHVLYNSNL